MDRRMDLKLLHSRSSSLDLAAPVKLAANDSCASEVGSGQIT